MKKIVISLICLLCLCGCSNSLGFQVSELKPVNGIIGGAVSGSIKNISNTDCAEISVYVDYKNGAIKDEGFFYIKVPKKGEMVSFEDETLLGASDISNWTDYKLKLNRIECVTTIEECKKDDDCDLYETDEDDYEDEDDDY